jgi:chemotaxis protein methyltransferase CheR
MIETTQFATQPIDLSDALFRKFAKLVYEKAGISLSDAKHELVRSRLLKRLRVLHISTFEDYYHYLSERDASGDELVHMLDSISTNKTDFFREIQHFDFLAESVLPAIIERAHKTDLRRIRIWSAGCSSGEEPYTLAMVIRDIVDGSWDTKILATDLSTRVLQTAYEGVYEEGRMAGVPAKYRTNCFEKERQSSGNVFRVKPDLRKMITFRRLNLMDPTYPFSGKFDVIFCRNVMIYFDKPTQEELVNKFHRYLATGGYLFIGHSESLTSLKTPFQFVRPTVYMRTN